MKEILFQRKIPVTRQVDVFIAGGGPAGLAAAVTAARMGASVFLAEKHQSFGGAAALSAVPAFMRFSDGVNFMAGGIGREIFDALYGPQTDYTEVEFPIDVEKLKRIYDDMMVKSGADFLFDTTLIGVQAENGLIDSVILQGHEDLFAVQAHTFIDCTGDGTLAVMAGAHADKGDEKGRMMPATLCSLWSNVDWERAVVVVGQDPDNRNLSQAFADGVFSVQDSSLPGMWHLPSDMGGGNIGHVFSVDGTREADITRGIIEARRRMPEYEFIIIIIKKAMKMLKWFPREDFLVSGRPGASGANMSSAMKIMPPVPPLKMKSVVTVIRLTCIPLHRERKSPNMKRTILKDTGKETAMGFPTAVCCHRIPSICWWPAAASAPAAR